MLTETRTRSYKKDDETLLNLTGGYEPLLKREDAYVYTEEGTIESPL
jgi:hypothetical protein